MTDRTFWIVSSEWPRDHAANVFLARAVNEVGKARFGGDWTGLEAVTPEPYHLWIDGINGAEGIPTPMVGTQNATHRTVVGLLSKYRPEAIPSAQSLRTALRWDMSADQWREGCEIARDIDHKNAPARQRFANALVMMRDALANGLLVSVLRERHGGSFSGAVHPDFWNIEKVQLNNRFYCCQMNPSQPFGIGVAGDAYKLIFITRDSLDAYKASLHQTAEVAPADDSSRPRRAEYGRWYKKQIEDSLTRRTIAKSHAIEVGVKDYKLSKRQAENERNAVLAGFPKVVQDVWRKSGPVGS